MTTLRYYADVQRHLVCVPYTVANLHRMADDLGIARCWFDAATLPKGATRSPHPHYDIPAKRLAAILADPRVIRVNARVVLGITKGRDPVIAECREWSCNEDEAISRLRSGDQPFSHAELTLEYPGLADELFAEGTRV